MVNNKILFKQIFVYLFIFVIMISHVPLNFAFSGAGAGTEVSPYQINSCDLLNETRDSLGAYYEVNTSFSCDVSPYNTSPGWLPISAFTGTFDGQNNIIDGLYINRTSGFVGLIGSTRGATISNIRLTNVDITGSYSVGGLVGYTMFSSSIDNSHVTGNVTGAHSVGGLVGLQEHYGSGDVNNSSSTATITGTGDRVGGLIGGRGSGGEVGHSYATGDVTGEDYVGGLVGSTNSPTKNSYATGNVTGTGNRVGGLVGSSSSTITNSYSTGSVTGTGDRVGGLSGSSFTITNSYSTGDVNGDERVGGLVGYVNYAIDNSYATGNVNGSSNVGGLLGFSFFLNIDDSYATGSVTGSSNVGGLIGGGETWAIDISNSFWLNNSDGADACIGDGSNPTGCEAKTEEEYFFNAGNAPMDVWDFDSIWDFGNNTYPKLEWNESVDAVEEMVGTGTLADPSNVSNCYDLQSMAFDVDANYSVVESFNCSLSPFNVSEGFAPVGTFTGSFDGQNNTIDGLYINRPSTGGIGLIGSTFGATFSNIRLTNVNITGASLTGGLIGGSSYPSSGSYASIDNVYVSGSVTGNGNSVGGLASSLASPSPITNSYTAVTVTGTGDGVGGLVGSSSGSITNSYSTGDVTTTGDRVGGLVGSSSSPITDSYSTGDVTTTGNKVGGLVGFAYEPVNNSYATGSVTGNGNSVGGLVGYTNDAIDNSYATGDVNGSSHVGGLIGHGYGSHTDNSYATGDVNGSSHVGGLIGYEPSMYGFGSLTDSFSTGSVTGATNVGGLVGICGVPITNSFWLNNSDGADACIGDGSNPTGCGVEDDISYFYNYSNAPMNVWDFVSIWTSALSPIWGYPKLVLWDSPTIVETNYTPSDQDVLDPDTTMRIYYNITDDENDLETVSVQWKNASVDWDEAESAVINSTILNTSTTSEIYYDINLSQFTEEGNYTFRVIANDSNGNYAFTNDTTIEVVWDCSWNIVDNYGAASDGDLGTTGGFFDRLALGNVTINNTGDVEYGSSGCNLKFARTASGSVWDTTNPYRLNFTTDYLDLESEDFPVGTSPGGLRYEVNGSEVTSVELSSGEDKVLEVYGVFPQVDSVLSEYPYFPIFANVTDTVDGDTNITINSKMVITPGAFLETGFEDTLDNPYTIYLKVNETHDFSAYVKNVVYGEDDNIAWNVSFNMTVPSAFDELIVDSSLNSSHEKLNDTDERNLNFSLEFNSSNMENLSIGTYSANTSALGYNTTGGELEQGTITSALSIIFACYGTADEVCVDSCRTYSEGLGIYVGTDDPDCGYCGDGVADADESCSSCVADVGACPAPSSGGGGGGGAGGSFDRSEAQFELLSGELQEFILPIENKLSGIKKDMRVTVSGENSQYVTVVPEVIDEIAGYSTYDLTVNIDAPSFFTSGKYLLKFMLNGYLIDAETGARKSHVEEKYVTLYVVEQTRDVADEYFRLANFYIEDMNESGLKLNDVLGYLEEMNVSYDEVNFLAVEEAFFKLEQIYNVVQDYEKISRELIIQIEWAKNYGIDVIETQKLYMLAGVIHKRGDYIEAAQKLQDALAMYSFETKGEFNLYYVVKNNPSQSIVALFASLLVLLSGTYVSRRTYLKRKLNLLKKEELLLLELMKVVQRYSFEENKMSMEEYYAAMNYYEKKLSEAIGEKIKTEAEINNLMNMKGKSEVLREEKGRVRDLIRTLQDDYMNKGNVETRVYQNMLRTYASRLTKVEEKLAFIETKKFIRSDGKKFKVFGVKK